MEIEAKFTLPDAGAVTRFRQLEQLADYTLSPGVERHFHDCFLDTADRRLAAVRHVLRRREEGTTTTMTLKGPGRVKGAVHRRAEWEVTLSPGRAAEDWRESPLYARVMALTGDAPLCTLFCLRQRRTFHMLRRDEREIAVLTVDEVTMGRGKAEQIYFELEIELTEGGTTDDLQTLAARLQTEHGLQPQPHSKFERGLALLGNASPAESLLTIPERAALLPLSVEAAPRYRRRALALLALDEGASTRQAGERAGLSPRRVRYWRNQFRQHRLDIFPATLFPAPETSPPAETPSPEPAAALPK
ncbi:MAG: CYTH domain-containing protein, partial [Caldilineae bacterium]